MLQLQPGSMLSSNVMAGDLLLIDTDGNMNTILDRQYVQVASIHMDPNPATGGVNGTDYHVTLEPAPGQFFPIQPNVTLQQDVSRVIHLGDSFVLNGFEDTSDNNGLSDPGNHFSFCDGAVPGCDDGVLVY